MKPFESLREESCKNACRDMLSPTHFNYLDQVSWDVNGGVSENFG